MCFGFNEGVGRPAQIDFLLGLRVHTVLWIMQEGFDNPQATSKQTTLTRMLHALNAPPAHRTRCMLMYAEHRRSSGDKVCCPLCRINWGPTAVRALKEEALAQQGEKRGQLYHCIAFTMATIILHECVYLSQVYYLHNFIPRLSTYSYGSVSCSLNNYLVGTSVENQVPPQHDSMTPCMLYHGCCLYLPPPWSHFFTLPHSSLSL